MRVLVTGASGFIGSNIANYLSERHFDVTGVYFKNPPLMLRDNVQTVRVNLADELSVNAVLENCEFDAIIHLAGEMTGKRAEQYLSNSVIATKNMIQYAEKKRVQTFIFGSSIMVYGNTETTVNEKSDRVNLDDYGQAKYFGERLLEDAEIPNRVVLRLTRTLGPYVNLSLPYLPRLGGLLLRNQPVTYFNPNTLYNNMTHISSMGTFLETIFENSGNRFSGYQVIGLGASEAMTLLEVTKYLREILHSTSELIERTQSIPRSNTHHIDISKAISMGFHPLSVQETLDRFADDLTRVTIEEGKMIWH